MTDPKQEMRARAREFRIKFNRSRGFNDYDCTQMDLLATEFASSERDRARELACGAVRKVMGNNSIPEIAIRQAFEEER